MNTPRVRSIKEEKYVLIVLAVLLVCLETGIRLFEDKLSGNIAHIFNIPTLAADVEQADRAVRLVFLGNSLTNNALDSNQVESYFAHQTSIRAIRVTPDATAIADWYCIYRNSFQTLENPPSHVIIGFAWDQLSDQYPVNATRLGGFFCQPDDIHGLSQTSLQDHQELLNFIAGMTSHLYVNREAIRNRLLDLLIPSYRSTTQRLNQVSQDITHKHPADAARTYATLVELTSIVNAAGSQLIVMAMPVIDPYPIDTELLRVLSVSRVPLIDLRNSNKITADMYLDPIHLNNHGSKVFSQLLTTLITPYISSNSISSP